jgi:hypothetical protein
MYSPGLMLSSTLAVGFSFTITDVNISDAEAIFIRGSQSGSFISVTSA